MARIRTIKPEFWTSEQVMECSRDTRLFFIGLWNFCDDHGRHPAQAKKLRALIFPGDDDVSSVDVRRMIDELSTNGLVVLYVVDSVEYIEVCGWSHQKIDRKQDPKFPAPADGIRRTLVEHSSLEKEGKGKEDISNASALDVQQPQDDLALTEAVAVFNSTAADVGWSKVQSLNPTRRTSLKARLRQCGGIDGWRAAMARARASPFLTGEGGREWRADFDFFLKASKFTKLMEGAYDRASHQARPDPRPSGTQRALAGLAQAASERSDSRLFAMDPGGDGFDAGPTGSRGTDGRPPGLAPLRLID